MLACEELLNCFGEAQRAWEESLGLLRTAKMGLSFLSLLEQRSQVEMGSCSASYMEIIYRAKLWLFLSENGFLFVEKTKHISKQNPAGQDNCVTICVIPFCAVRRFIFEDRSIATKLSPEFGSIRGLYNDYPQSE